MFRLAVRNALAGRARLLRTVLAIAIGVGFVTGTFVLADTTIEAFERAGAEQGGDFDFVVRSVAPFTGTGSIGDREPLPDTLIERIAAVEGVAGVDAGVVGYAQVVAPDGTAVTPASARHDGLQFGVLAGGDHRRSAALRAAISTALALSSDMLIARSRLRRLIPNKRITRPTARKASAAKRRGAVRSD